MSFNEASDTTDAFWNLCMSSRTQTFTDFSSFTRADVKDWKIASLLSFLAYHESETLEKIRNATEKEIADEKWLEENAKFHSLFRGDVTIKSQGGIFENTRKMFYRKGMRFAINKNPVSCMKSAL